MSWWSGLVVINPFWQEGPFKITPVEYFEGMIIWMGLFTQISGCSISWLLFFWGGGRLNPLYESNPQNLNAEKASVIPPGQNCYFFITLSSVLYVFRIVEVTSRQTPIYVLCSVRCEVHYPFVYGLKWTVCTEQFTACYSMRNWDNWNVSASTRCALCWRRNSDLWKPFGANSRSLMNQRFFRNWQGQSAGSERYRINWSTSQCMRSTR